MKYSAIERMKFWNLGKIDGTGDHYVKWNAPDTER